MKAGAWSTAMTVAVGLVLAACVGASPTPTSTPILNHPSGAPLATATPSPAVTATVAPTATSVPSSAPSPTPAPVLFRTPVALDLPGDPEAVTTGDFNGDGKVDLVTANSDGTVSLLVGDGDGGFQTIDLEAELSADSGPASIAVADLNGDGRLDVVIAHTGASDRGTGTDDIVVLLAKNVYFEKLVRAAGVNPQAIAMGDFNDDHRPDLATANEGDQVSVFLGRGDGTFDDPLHSPSGALFSSGISAADFNGDGELDVATANSLIGRGRSTRTVSVLLGSGDGTFGEPVVAPVKGPQPISPEVADLNRDQVPDVITPNGDPSHEVSVLLGLGDGRLGESIQYRAGADAHSLVIADLDGDGNFDIVAWNSGVRGGLVDRGLSVLFGNGDGTFGSNIDLVSDLEAEVAAVVDVNGDGMPDVVLQGVGQLVLLISMIPQG